MNISTQTFRMCPAVQNYTMIGFTHYPKIILYLGREWVAQEACTRLGYRGYDLRPVTDKDRITL